MLAVIARHRFEFRQLFVVTLILSLLLALTACATSPLAIAQTPEQKYAAAKFELDAVLQAAAVFVEDQSVDAGARRSVQAAVAQSHTVYLSANDAYVKFVAAKGELAAGATPTDKVTIAAKNLERWLGDLDTISKRIAAIAHK